MQSVIKFSLLQLLTFRKFIHLRISNNHLRKFKWLIESRTYLKILQGIHFKIKKQIKKVLQVCVIRILRRKGSNHLTLTIWTGSQKRIVLVMRQVTLEAHRRIQNRNWTYLTYILRLLLWVGLKAISSTKTFKKELLSHANGQEEKRQRHLRHHAAGRGYTFLII